MMVPRHLEEKQFTETAMEPRPQLLFKLPQNTELKMADDYDLVSTVCASVLDHYWILVHMTVFCECDERIMMNLKFDTSFAFTK